MQSKGGMVDVSGKEASWRTAIAESVLEVDEATLRAIGARALPKADPLPTARAAALLAVKGTAALIPHCHPLPVSDADVEFLMGRDTITVRCRVKVFAGTGAEMEALCGATIAALTLYDMIKAVCPGAAITRTRLLEKTGGKSGTWRAEAGDG